MVTDIALFSGLHKPLATWRELVTEKCDRGKLRSHCLGEAVERPLVAEVTDRGYAADLTDDEVVKIGRDPFLVAYALRDSSDRCVVTTEVSRPGRQRANRHIPDVCEDFNVNCCDTFEFLDDLDFTTSWSSSET